MAYKNQKLSREPASFFALEQIALLSVAILYPSRVDIF